MKIIKIEKIVCPTCNGAGRTMTPRTREEHGHYVTCSNCDGKRVVELVTYERKLEDWRM